MQCDAGRIWMVTCSTPVLSLALVSTNIMLYLPRWIPNGGWEQTKLFKQMNNGGYQKLNWETDEQGGYQKLNCKTDEQSGYQQEIGNLSAQSLASCTPTFLRPPRSHLLPTCIYFILRQFKLGELTMTHRRGQNISFFEASLIKSIV